MSTSQATALALERSASSKQHPSTLAYSITIFLSAFLCFQVQLIAGKFMLPRFGGSPSVWNTSLLCFQILLLGGYAYAHFLSTRISGKLQGVVHLALLTSSIIMLAILAYVWRSPITPGLNWNSIDSSNPVSQVIRYLATTVGIPFLLLSTTGPLLQTWFSRTEVQSPYRLYALSNLGSLLGLATYPFLFERFLTLSLQSWLWLVGYVGFFMACGSCAWKLTRHERRQPAAASVPPQAALRTNQLSLSSVLLWIALPACASAMLIATTNLITQDIAVIPLLWVVPLGIYLLSFILCFQTDHWYHRGIFHGLYLVAFLLVLQALLVPWGAHVLLQLGASCLALFAVCMVCHGELARSKPASSQLSTFYLMLSAGGALGSLFVVLIAPRLFDDIGEFPLTLLACGGLLLLAVALDRRSWLYDKRTYRAVALAGLVLVMLQGYRYGMGLIGAHRGKLVFRTRNFFGVKRVGEDSAGFWLLHGNTVHGVQLKDRERRDEPTLYYKRLSGVGLLLTNYPRPQSGSQGLRVGVVGLGAGTLASYGRQGDYFRFYEIDPQVVDLSQAQTPAFTFVKDSPAKIDISIGDARLSLADEATRGQFQRFDVLVVDAFNSDAVPVHLLTQEAMGLYLRHLSGPNAVMAFHLTNRSLDLRSVVVGLSVPYNLFVTEVDDSFSKWVLISANPQMLSLPGLKEHTQRVQIAHTIPLWTDDYSNIFQVLSTN